MTWWFLAWQKKAIAATLAAVLFSSHQALGRDPSDEQVDKIDWVDAEGDSVSLKSEEGRITLYNNGEVVIPQVQEIQIEDLKISFEGEEDSADTWFKEVDSILVEKVRALVSKHNDAGSGTVGDVVTGLPDFAEFTDVQGDLVSLRSEGGQLNLFGNNELFLSDIVNVEVDFDSLMVEFTSGAKHLEQSVAESRAASVQDLEKIQVLFQEHMSHKPVQEEHSDELVSQITDLLVPAQLFVEALAARAEQKPRTQVDGNRGDGSAKRPRELIIYGQGDPSAPGYKDSSLPVMTFTGYHVLSLGRRSFKQIVLPHPSNVAANWIVLYCYSWWEPCQKFAEPYAAWANEWEGRLNEDLFTKRVRFAWVDCATDKELCNAQDVDSYPFMKYYSEGTSIAKFSGGLDTDVKRAVKWLNKQLADETLAENTRSDAEEIRTAGPVVFGLFHEQGISLLLALVVISMYLRAVLMNTASGVGLQLKATPAAQSTESPLVAAPPRRAHV
jgi:hypothetical protein